MKIAFTAKGQTWDSEMEPRFGRTDFLFIYDEESSTETVHDNSQIKDMEHGAGPKLAQVLFDMGVNVLITGNGPGGNAAEVLKKIGVTSYVGAGDMTVREAYDKFSAGELSAAESK